ncbi:DUF3231 family protein [Paenibacillus sp. GCM10023248]|uniref:DUF3231 family protein n=1 Tax=Bacillales TaxID=1385 RepID=UPI002378A4E3|nr:MULTISPECIES: DUF3231 family protein [Bacillales]MDD9270224.1 DUF3231 family protein [Paenibacillus sp. MAHUQ-63]MDR6880361.1 hypothetical protein [Bacillus sp. 3255]
MTSILKAVNSLIKTFIDDEPKPPLHVGEVMDLWKYLVFIEEAIVLEQIGRNTTTDSDLISLLTDAIDMCSTHSNRIKKFMEEEGVPIPPLPEDKTKSSPNAVPMGAKMTDDEIANILSAKLLLAFKECARSMTETYRNDIGLKWAGFMLEHAKFGAELKTTMRKRGWIKVPPQYFPPGLPTEIN